MCLEALPRLFLSRFLKARIVLPRGVTLSGTNTTIGAVLDLRGGIHDNRCDPKFPTQNKQLNRSIRLPETPTCCCQACYKTVSSSVSVGAIVLGGANYPPCSLIKI